MAAVMAQQAPLHTSNLFMNAKQPQTGPSPPEAYLYGTKGVYASPVSSTPPSANISPTNIHVRQLRQPRQPLYIPAALRPPEERGTTRPTDIPARRPQAPDTPPSSKDNSFDSGFSRGASSSSLDTAPHPASPEVEDVEHLRRGLSRAASDSLDSVLGEVTGYPTTAHWKPDASAPECTICHQQFTWFWRRHHCRRCGNVVCENHSARRIPLDQNARYHPEGVESRACDPCFDEWTIVQRLRCSRSGSGSSQGTALPIPSQQATGGVPEDMRVGSMARSEGGMVWSTF